MTRRRLHPDEVELWRQVAETADRLHPEHQRFEAPKPNPKPHKTPRARLPDFTVGQMSKPAGVQNDLMPGLSERLSKAPVRMDHKAFGKMKRGKLVPEARIDLHGMTLDRAHPALTGFILRAHSSGKRLVLVITGKGKTKEDDGPIPIRRGVLKHNVPQWLMMPPLSAVVLQVSEAHLSHGGTGAYYVYLRRRG
ncbi:Smr/MutS family protein [Thalassovita taeanensis]|uniref:DNA-nicking endonuclease, Smr domain n=1 Tax=Thalassovita taeanensis TaxID=657014 RepID=A0A1H9JII2_9RHOB|nr:Smr/MutS family protein [Thalassovita taeanensis]SEQ86714.1 DNA-nicking endonuclease, Smr domain [Thalassovita taeanensis]